MTVAAETFENITMNLSPLVRHETLEGREYYVVPVVMLTEGVHNGSEGPLLYPGEEIGKTPGVWDHKPIVVYHPPKGSACEPAVLNSRKVGMLLNTKYAKGNAKKKTLGKLTSEAWLEKSRLPLVDERLIGNLESGEVMEVSTGLYTDNEGPEGEWNGEMYQAIARNYRPDHLALLPDQVGACSIADGAGLLRNQEGLVFATTPAGREAQVSYNKYYSAQDRAKMSDDDFGDPGKKAFPVHDQEDLNNAAHLIGHASDPGAVRKRLIAIAKRKGLAVPAAWKKTTKNSVPTEGMSHSTIRSKIYDAYRNGKGPDGQAAEAYSVGTNGDPGHIEDVYDDFHIRSNYDNKSSGYRYYKQGHEITPEGECYLTGSPEEVRRVQEYRTVDGSFVGNAATTKPIEGEGQKMEKKVRVDHLIANGGWEEGDRTTLMAFDDAKLTKLCEKTATPLANAEKPKPADPPVLNPEKPAVINTKTPTPEEYIASLPPGPIREMVVNSLNATKKETERLVGVITNAKGNRFNKEYLEAQSIEVLNGIAALAAPDAAPARPSYYGAGVDSPAPVINDAPLPEPLVMPTINFGKTETAAPAK